LIVIIDIDLALQIVNDLPDRELPVVASVSVLKALAGKPDAFATLEKPDPGKRFYIYIYDPHFQ
jgi:hypothetical protein